MISREERVAAAQAVSWSAGQSSKATRFLSFLVLASRQ